MIWCTFISCKVDQLIQAFLFFSCLPTVRSRLDQMFSDAFSKDHQLIQADPKHSLYLACALMVRGNVQVSDVRRNIERSEENPLFLYVILHQKM